MLRKMGLLIRIVTVMSLIVESTKFPFNSKSAFSTDILLYIPIIHKVNRGVVKKHLQNTEHSLTSSHLGIHDIITRDKNSPAKLVYFKFTRSTWNSVTNMLVKCLFFMAFKKFKVLQKAQIPPERYQCTP